MTAQNIPAALFALAVMIFTVLFLNRLRHTGDDLVQTVRQEADAAEDDAAARELAYGYSDEEYPARAHFTVPADAPALTGAAGSPVEAQLLILPYGQPAPKKRKLPTYCPTCALEDWTRSGQVSVHYPKGTPVLCPLHAETLIIPALRGKESC